VIKKSVLISLLFLLSLPVFLLATLPASVAWEKVISPLTKTKSVGVKAKAFSGSAWDGAAYITFRHLEGVISWDLHLADMLGGSLPISLDLYSTAGELELLLDVSLSDQSLSLEKMRLNASTLNPFLRPQRVKMDGEVFAKDVNITIDDRWISSLSGRFSWSGGAVSYPAGREMHERVLPSYNGQVATGDDGLIELGIRDQDASFDVMRGSWNTDGEALWEVSRRVLDIANEPWAENSSESDVIFKVKKVLPRSFGK